MSHKNKSQVLIVEDDCLIADRLINILTNESYEAINVETGEAAIQYARENDGLLLILMDIRLKGEMDGVEAAEKIREIIDIPVIYLTAYSDRSLIQRARKTNSSGYLIKPIRASELIAAIEMAISKYQLDKQQKELNARIYAIRKRESIGLMASALAHHYNNLTMIVQGNTELIAEILGQESTVDNFLQKIVQASIRTSALTQQVLKYTGMYASEAGPIEINISKLIMELDPMIKMSVLKDITVTYDLAQEIKSIIIADFDIRQLIVELVANAIAAITESGHITISTGELCNYVVPPTEFSVNNVPNDYVFLEIKDNGCGMDVSTKESMFDPFFTSHSFGRGIGLAAVSGIVKKCCGSILVDSVPGGGTCIKVLFPVLDK